MGHYCDINEIWLTCNISLKLTCWMDPRAPPNYEHLFRADNSEVIATASVMNGAGNETKISWHNSS